MRRSKLELHLDILKILEHGKPMRPTHIMYKVNVCYKFLEEYLEFLIQQNLVERKLAHGRKAKYSITQKGLNLLRTCEELKEVLPEIEEKSGEGFLMHWQETRPE